MAPREPEPSAGATVAGRYELVREMARGGMGTVWVATDNKLGRDVALKVMRRESLEAFEDAQGRFEREAKAAAALRSGHVVQVHDYGVADGVPFIAMELLEGESLKDRLERGHLGVIEAADILRQVAKGLKAAHRAGLIHRDLKPSNIFVTQRDDREVVKLLDFGVVKTVMSRGSDDTASGILLGTPQFMSPEQARGLRKIDHRADLWSLAVVLYLALTGHNPFDSEAEAVGDIVIRVCIEPIASPSVMNPSLGEGIDEFFATALARDPDDRFQSVEQLTEAFMLAAELSYAGLDDGPERSGPGNGSHPSLDLPPAPPSEPSLGAILGPSSEPSSGGVAAPPPEPSLDGSPLFGDAPAVPSEVFEPGDLVSEDAAPDSVPGDLVEDPSSSGSSMAASVVDRESAEPPPPPPRRGILAAVAAITVVVGGYALSRSDPPPSQARPADSSLAATTGKPPSTSATTGAASATASTPPSAGPTAEPTAEPVASVSAQSSSSQGVAPRPPRPTPRPRPEASASASSPPPPPPPPKAEGGGPPTWFPE